MCRFIPAVFLVALFIAGSAVGQEIAAPQAPESKGPQPPVTAWNGSFRHSIPIEVPAFRGLEPKLALSYDSARGIRNIPSAGGILGLGWSLDGVSVIERVSGSKVPAAGEDKQSSGRGLPAYGAAGMPPDSFSLDGDELIACSEVQTTGSTPSCAVAGGAGETRYAARIENYQRIRQVDNRWLVTARDGTVFRYETDEQVSFSQTFRWYLSRVTDTSGNFLDYSWNCNPDHECRIGKIDYLNAGTTTPVASIRVFSENRNDIIRYPTGKDIRKVTKRIKTIEVKFGSETVRAYKLGYERSAATGFSRLTNVQEIGRPAVTSEGIISGGTAMPAYAMTYQDVEHPDGSPNFLGQEWTSPMPFHVGSSIETPLGDFNGDGFAPDFYSPTIVYNGGTYHSWDGGTNGTYTCTTKLRLATGQPSSIAPLYIDDPAIRVPCTENNVSEISSPPSDPAAYYARLSNIRNSDPGPGHDFDGDGADDYVEVNLPNLKFHKLRKTDVSPYLDVTTFMTAMSESFSGGFDGGIATVADVTGDGAADIITRNNHVWTGDVSKDKDGNSATMQMLDWPSPTFPQSFGYPNYHIAYEKRVDQGDFNGDGKADILVHQFIEGNWTARIHLSTGTAFESQPQVATPWPGLTFHTSAFIVADANGDGMTDVIAFKRVPPTSGAATSFEVTQFLSNGRTFEINDPPVFMLSGFDSIPEDGYFGKANLAGGGGTPQYLASYEPPLVQGVNINGDGRIDFILPVKRTENGSKAYYIARSTDNGYALGGVIRPLTHPDDFVHFRPERVADFNGDGLTDFYDASEGNSMRINNSVIPDLLSTITEPLGGKLSVTYRSSAGLPDTRLPFIMNVVDKITARDGRGNVVETGFSYEGGKWSAADRQFMGFRKVTADLPSIDVVNGMPKVATTYQQSTACLGKVSLVESLDKDLKLLAKTDEGYTIDTVAPLICLHSSTRQSTIVGLNQKTTRINRGYDLYGNETLITDYGEWVPGAGSDNGDERTTWRVFCQTKASMWCPVRRAKWSGRGQATRLSGLFRMFAQPIRVPRVSPIRRRLACLSKSGRC